VLNEEALIVVVTLIASGLLVLGVLNLLWPTRPRHPVRVDAPIPRDERRLPPAESSPSAPSETVDAELTSVAVNTERAREAERVSVDVEARVESEESRAPAWVLERCRALAAQSRFDDVLATAMVALENERAGESEATAALWREVALARRHLGHRNGAVSAFCSAIVAADVSRDDLRRELALWAIETTRRAVAERHDAERFDALESARAMLVGARAGFDPDPDVEAAYADFASDYWPAYEAHVRALVDAQDFSEAYRLVTEALADGDVPPERRTALDGIRSETLAARIVALVDRAVASIDEAREWDAVGALERAETLYRSASGVSKPRLLRAAERLAAGYVRLARRRVETREFEEAVDPLFRAFRLDALGDADRDEARSTLAETIQAVAALRASAIHEVAMSGNREAALVQAEKLWALLRSAIALGAPRESLTSTLATTRELLAGLGARVESP
jgi:tetratricopeptide (TPR) repeat protein